MQDFFNFLNFKKPKKLVFIVFNSFGEFDFIAPLAHKILLNQKYQIKIIVLNLGVFKQFQNCKYYKEIFKKLSINVNRAFFSFDTNQKNYHNFFKIIFKIKNLFLFLINLPQLFFEILKSDLCFVENSTSHRIYYLYEFINKSFKKTFILYPHTAARHCAIPTTHHKARANFLNNSPFIVTDKMEIEFHKARNLNGTPLIISYPPQNKRWIQFIENNFNSPFKDKRFVSIFLNGIRDEYFEPKNYYDLLLMTLESLKITHGNKLIILKRHPRPYRIKEELDVLNKILEKFENMNIKFDNSPNFILSLYSDCNLIMNNGSIFMSHAMNKNSFFLFLEDEGLKIWPEGRAPKYYNLPCISNKLDLIKELKKINKVESYI